MIHIIQYYVQSYLTMKMFSSVKYPIMNYDKWIVHIHDIDVEVTRIKMHALGMHESISGARGFRNRADWKLNASFRPSSEDDRFASRRRTVPWNCWQICGTNGLWQWWWLDSVHKLREAPVCFDNKS